MTNKVNDDKQTALHGEIGKPTGTQSVNDVEMQWLTLRGYTEGGLNERWRQEFFNATAGAAKYSFTFDDAARIYLAELGLTGTLPEMWHLFWSGKADLSEVSLGVGWTKVGFNDYQFNVPPGAAFVAMTLINVIVGQNYNISFDASGDLPATALVFRPGDFAQDTIIAAQAYNFQFLADNQNGVSRFAVQDIAGVTQFNISNLVVTDA